MNSLIIKVIKKYLNDEGIDYNEENLSNLSLRDDLELDSIEIIELIIVIEDELKITISDDLIEDIEIVQNLIDAAVKSMS